MAYFIDKLGLDFLAETEEKTKNLMLFAAREGTGIIGYYGSPYFNLHLGEAEFVLRTIREGDQLKIVGMDTHGAGPCVWDVCLTGMKINRKNSDILRRRCVVSKGSDGTGLAVVDIVNADVLPSFEEGERYRLQMIAFPVEMDYFADEAEYAASQPEGDEASFLLSDGMAWPWGMMQNRNPDSKRFESDENLDDLMQIRGTVRDMYHGVVTIGEDKFNSYIRCLIDTEFGQLEIVHTIDDIEEAQHKNMHPGAVVSGLFVLSADAAIYEYENGIVLDEEHDLKLLRSVIMGADANRMRSVLAENISLADRQTPQQCEGQEAVLAWLQNRFQHKNDPITACLATVTADSSQGEKLPEGRRCIALHYGQENCGLGLVFVDLDDGGKIVKIRLLDQEGISFTPDQKPQAKDSFDAVRAEGTVAAPMIARARRCGIIDADLSDEEVLDESSNRNTFVNNAEQMIDVMPDRTEKNLENMFAYLFAKAIEAQYAEQHPGKPDTEMGGFATRLLVSYVPQDAWNGTVHTLLDPEKDRKVAGAMELGKQFYQDYVRHCAAAGRTDDDEALMQALLVVQRLGKLYAAKLLC